MSTDLTPARKTKTQEIKELLTAGLTPYEIANRLQTSVGYVYRVSSIFGKSGKITITRSKKNTLTSSSGQRVSRSEKHSLEVEHNFLLSMESLTPDDLERLYSLFMADYKPWEIVSQYGFNPEAVEYEYRRYRRMLEFDRDHSREAILEFVVRLIPDDPSFETMELIKRHKKSGLTFDEVKLLLNLNNIEQRSKGEEQLLARISDPYGATPDGWTKLYCAACKVPFADLMVKKDTAMEKVIRQRVIVCSKHK